mgnify:CR=1 FL=1
MLLKGMKSGVIIKGLFINYHVLNKEGQTKLVFLHGWRSNGLAFQKAAETLASEDFAVYCPDLPGFGESDMPAGSFSISDYRDIVSEFIEKAGIKGCVVIGHSFGGRVAIRLLSGNPEIAKKLVLIDSAGFPSRRKKKAWAFFAKIVRPLFSLKLMSGARKSIYRLIGAEDYVATPELKETFVNIVDEDLTGYLSSISQPTLIVWGENDKETPVEFARKMGDMIPDSSVKIIKNAGHFSFLDDPQEFNRLIIEFLKK